MNVIKSFTKGRPNHIPRVDWGEQGGSQQTQGYDTGEEDYGLLDADPNSPLSFTRDVNVMKGGYERSADFKKA